MNTELRQEEKRWCSLCFANNRDINGIICASELSSHYECNHALQRNKWPVTIKQKAYSVRYVNDEPFIYDHNAPSNLPLTDIYLTHQASDYDIIQRIQRNIRYPLAWYGRPIRPIKNEYAWSIRTVWSDACKSSNAPIKKLTNYKDLMNKLESEYPEVLDDVLCRTPSNINDLTFKSKALQIIKELKKCWAWKQPFMYPVDEKLHCAPDYYKIIPYPMDLGTLKQLIDSDQITQSKAFCSKMMSIWKNAQIYNPKEHPIHILSKKCESESRRLFDKYLLDQDENNANIACIHYEDNKRKALLCGVCLRTLVFLIWIDGRNGKNIKCNHCQREIEDVSFGYYHCNGIEHDHEPISICTSCAEKYYESKQICDLPFYGLWIDVCFDRQQLWYEAIVCHQESNQIFYNLVYSTSTLINIDECDETVATITSESDPLAFEIDANHSLCFNRGQLNEDHSLLTFIDCKDEKNGNEYKKVCGSYNVFRMVISSKRQVKPTCSQCNSKMMFMRKNMIPSKDAVGKISCNLHKDYYGRQKSMDPCLRCSSFSAFEYDNAFNIEAVSFYFSCTKCRNFHICGGYVYFCVSCILSESFNDTLTVVH